MPENKNVIGAFFRTKKLKRNSGTLSRVPR